MNQNEDVKVGVFQNWVMAEAGVTSQQTAGIVTEAGAPPTDVHAAMPIVAFDPEWVTVGGVTSWRVVEQRRRLFLPQYPSPQPSSGYQKLSNLIRAGAPLWSGQSIGAWTRLGTSGGRYACALEMAMSAIGGSHENPEILDGYLGFHAKTALCGYPHYYDVWNPVDRAGNVARDKPRVYGSIPIVVQYLNDIYGWNPGKISRWLEGLGL